MFTVLKHVEGVSGRRNTLFVAKEGELGSVEQHVIFFPGDIQNTQEEMSRSSYGEKWKNWSYEHVCSILTKRFAHSLVWLIQPFRMHDGTFSCFDNFLQCSVIGSPEDYEKHDAIRHLDMLLSQGIKMVLAEEDANVDGGLTNRLTKLPVTLVGFSKGCVVLNQVVYELDVHCRDMQTDSHEDLPEIECITGRLKSFFFLDGGHSDLDISVWITEPEVISRLAALGCEVQVHVTPWQIQDTSRPHIGIQERIFVDTLKRCSVRVKEKLHFPDERNFRNHFEVLENF